MNATFHPQNPDDWDAYLDRTTTARPTVTGATLDADTLDAFVAYNLSLGPIPTDDVRAIRDAIERAQLRNRHAPLHGQHVVVVDGPPMAGKTYAVLGCALEQTRAARQQPPPGPTCQRTTTWAYTEVTQHHGAASITGALGDAIGIVKDSGDRTPQYLSKIRHLAPKVGLVGYIVDDSHGILGARSRDSTSLATTLKGLITGIPATAVIVGANLREQGIFSGSAGEQVRLRSAGTWVTCAQWPPPDGKSVTGWERLAATMSERLAFPGGPEQCRLNQKAVVASLAEGSAGRPGIAINWVKEAAIHAITHESTLDGEALTATRPALHDTPPT